MTILIAQGFSEEVTLISNSPTPTVGSLNTNAAGSSFLCIIRAYSPSVTAVTDSFSNTYSLLGSQANGSTTTYAYLCTNGAGGSTHRPLVTQSSGDLAAVSFSEITGGTLSALVDGAVTTALDASSPFNATVATVNATDLIVGIGASNGATNPVTYTPGAGFTLVSGSSFTNGANSDTIGVMTQRVTVTGTYGPNFTTSTGSNAAVITFALKELAAQANAGPVKQPGPGISPDVRTMFRPRPLSSFIAPGTAPGAAASGFGFAVGLLTGVNPNPAVGYIRTAGPGISPAYQRTFDQIRRSTFVPTLSQIAGVAFGSGQSAGQLTGAGALQGVAGALGYTNGANLLGSGALSGVASGEGYAVGGLNNGVLTNISGIAFSAAAVAGSATGAGALFGRASVEGSTQATLVGAAALAGVASAEGAAVARLNATAVLRGFAYAEGQTSAQLAGNGVLQGVAAGSTHAAASLLGVGALSGCASGDGSAYGSVLGAGALTGVAFTQGESLGPMTGTGALAGVSVGQSYALGLLLPVGAGQMQGVAAGFSFAYGLVSGAGHVFGWATVTALSQNGLPVARACFIEESACRVTATYFDSSGVLFVPNQVRYRIDDVLSGAQILDWTDVAPGVANTITVTSAENAMISLSRKSEAHQVLFEITDGAGNVSYADVQFDLVRVAGLAS